MFTRYRNGVLVWLLMYAIRGDNDKNVSFGVEANNGKLSRSIWPSK